MKRKFQDKETISHKMIRANESDRISESSDEITTSKNASDEMIQANESEGIPRSSEEITTSKNASDLEVKEMSKLKDEIMRMLLGVLSKVAEEQKKWANESGRISESSEEISTSKNASDLSKPSLKGSTVLSAVSASSAVNVGASSSRGESFSTSSVALEIFSKCFDEIVGNYIDIQKKLDEKQKVDVKEISDLKDKIKRVALDFYRGIAEKQKESGRISESSEEISISKNASDEQAKESGRISESSEEISISKNASDVDVKEINKIKDELKKASLDFYRGIAEKQKEQAKESGRISESSEEISISKNASDFCEPSLKRSTVMSEISASSAVNVGASSSRRESFFISNLNSVLNKLSRMCQEDFDVEVAVREISRLNGEMKRIMLAIRSDIERKLKFSKPSHKESTVLSKISACIAVNMGASSSRGESISTSNLDNELNNTLPYYEDIDIEVALKIFTKLKDEIKRVKLAIRRKIQEDQQVINRRYSSVPGG